MRLDLLNYGAVEFDSESSDRSLGTLGDVLYGKNAESVVPEQEWTALVGAVAARDKAALHALYERAHRPVYTLIVRMTGNRETAEELTVDLFTTSGAVLSNTTRRTARCSAGS